MQQQQQVCPFGFVEGPSGGASEPKASSSSRSGVRTALLVGGGLSLALGTAWAVRRLARFLKHQARLEQLFKEVGLWG